MDFSGLEKHKFKFSTYEVIEIHTENIGWIRCAKDQNIHLIIFCVLFFFF